MAKKVAIVTGASSGIGLEIAKRLLNDDWKVFGIARNFDNVPQQLLLKEGFHKVVLDLLDTNKLQEFAKEVLSSYSIDLLINNAGVAYYGPHEEMNIPKITNMIRTNFEVPLIMTNLFLRNIKKTKGTIINISSVTAEQVNTHGCTYGATKAGLLSFGESLFAEVRKYGVKVATILPDMTDTNLYRNSDLKVSDDEMAYLSSDEVADVIMYLLSQRDGLNITKILIKPQYHKIGRRSSKKNNSSNNYRSC